jgi:hypothetical protein
VVDSYLPRMKSWKSSLRDNMWTRLVETYRDLLILGLLKSTLVVLLALAHHILLNVVDSLIQAVLVLLARLASSRGFVGLVFDPAGGRVSYEPMKLMLVSTYSMMIAFLVTFLI